MSCLASEDFMFRKEISWPGRGEAWQACVGKATNGEPQRLTRDEQRTSRTNWLTGLERSCAADLLPRHHPTGIIGQEVGLMTTKMPASAGYISI
jgi:hypothetical protein